MFQENVNFGEEILIPDAQTFDFGVLATSHLHFDSMDLQFGVRYDHRNIDVEQGINRNFDSFNGAIGIKVDLDEQWVSRLNIASGYRAPNLAELTSDGSHEGTNRYEIGNPELTNEKNVQLDLALEYQSEHFELFANAFYNRVNNYIFISPTGAFIEEQPVYVYEQDDASLYGGEIGMHIHPHPLDWLHFEHSFEMVVGKQDNDDYLPLIPANKWNNRIRFEFDKTWLRNGFGFVGLSLVFDQDNVADFETRTGGFSLVNAGFGGEVRLFELPVMVRLAGNNLLNRRYIDHLSRLKVDGIPNIGRNITVSLSYNM